MNFRYDPEKTVQAVALFLKMHIAPMEYMKLIKLLYMADRMALNQMEETITGDMYVSMDRGPVLSKVYDLISHGPRYDKENPWFKHISAPENYCVKLLTDPGTEELCEEEEDIIKGAHDNFGHVDVWRLSELTHFFPEWKNPYGSAIPIRIEDILRELGRDVEAVQRNIQKENYLDMLLGNWEENGFKFLFSSFVQDKKIQGKETRRFGNLPVRKKSRVSCHPQLFVLYTDFRVQFSIYMEDKKNDFRTQTDDWGTF